MSDPLIVAEDLHYTYADGTQALDGVSFSIAAGEAVALVGANGAGKSTLLQHLNGYLLPTRGTLRIGEMVLSRQTLPAVRRSVGMVFQDPDDQLFMPTVFEDVAFGPVNLGLAAEEVRARVATALETVGMAHLASRAPYRLSGGEKRAVAIATVLAMEPDILVMDEPSANLDPGARRRLIKLLASFTHTKIIATHDLELVVQLCPRTLLLGRGVLVADSPTLPLLSDEAVMLRHDLETPHILRHMHPHGGILNAEC